MAFPSVKNPLQKKSFMAILGFLVSAAAAAPGYGSIPKDKYEKASKVEPTYFELVGDDTNTPGNVNVKATTAGITAYNTPEPAKEEPAKQDVKVAYPVVELEDLPEIKRGGNKGESYNFSGLAAPKPKFEADGVTPITDPKTGKHKMSYSSFFVAATSQRDNPARALSSTAASAQKRFSDGREFTVRKAYGPDGVSITGAHVIRIK